MRRQSMSGNPLLDIIAQAQPLLEQLRAAQANVASYKVTAEQYAARAKDEQDLVDRLMVDLNHSAAEFVKAYLAREAGSNGLDSPDDGSSK